MPGSRRTRCETETPEDVEQQTGGHGNAKKPKTDNGNTGNTGATKRQRPPRNAVEEQLLNKLDQEEFVKITKKLSSPENPATLDLEKLVRSVFWDKFYARDGEVCPEGHTAMLNARGRDTVTERRKSCPWFFWGLDGYTRQKFPEGWTFYYEDGEQDAGSFDSPLLFPLGPTQSANTPTEATRVEDKTGSFALPLNELEETINNSEKEISMAMSLRNRKKAESKAMRKKAADFQTKSDRFNQMATAFHAKFLDSHKKAAECKTEADRLDAEVAQSDGILKEKQPLFEVQKLVLAARKANHSYGNQ
ncbi:hypothetical protein V492_07702 [Pseudogymnoascus sp. VKM F-4246]|nr:hypothetical protein V492_07702 [Pseudogymnoascus sp. VKM F-4246]